MAQLSFVERITETVTLAHAQRTAEATPELVRARLVGALALGRQEAEAAESLFDNGHPAEAIKLARASLEHTLDAVLSLEVAPPPKARAPEDAAKVDAEAPAEAEAKADAEAEAKADAEAKANGNAEAKANAEAPAEAEAKANAEAEATATATATATPPGWRGILSSRGAAPVTLDGIDAVLVAMRASEAPRLDEQVTPEHAAAFHRVLAARVAVDRQIHPAALSPAQVRAQRRNRIALVVIVATCVVVGLVLTTRRPVGTFATASAHFGNLAQYAPENAIDGRPDTEWLLPDRASGWLEVTIGPPRRVNAISLINSVNPPYEDRAARDYTLEIWANGEMARTIEGTIPFSTARTPVRHDVGIDGVERVRVVVRTWHELGGGLAEVTVE